MEPKELARLPGDYSKVKSGPFSRQTPPSGRERLCRDIGRSNEDGFEHRVKTVRQRETGGSLFAEGARGMPGDHVV